MTLYLEGDTFEKPSFLVFVLDFGVITPVTHFISPLQGPHNSIYN